MERSSLAFPLPTFPASTHCAPATIAKNESSIWPIEAALHSTPRTPLKWPTLRDKIRFDQGRDLLYFFRGSDDTHMINVSCTCCHSFLCARNTDFHGNAVATLPQYANVSHAPKDLQFLSFRKFWPNSDTLENVPEGMAEFWKTDNGGFDGTEGFMEALGVAMASNTEPLTEKIEGTISFDDLVKGQTVLTV